MRVQIRFVSSLLLGLMLGSLLICPRSRAADGSEDRDRLRSIIAAKVKLEVGCRLNPGKIAEQLGLSYPPQEPSRSRDEIKEAAAEAARNEVDQRYPTEQIEQFRKETEEQYALWEEGDIITFVIRGGRGRTPTVTGRLRHVSPIRVQVGNRWIARQDIERETLACLDPEVHASVVEALVRKKRINREVERERVYDEVHPTHVERLMKESHYVKWRGRWIAADKLLEKALEYHRRKLAGEILPDVEREVFTENNYVQSEGEWVSKGLLDRLKKALGGGENNVDPPPEDQAEQEASADVLPPVAPENPPPELRTE